MFTDGDKDINNRLLLGCIYIGLYIYNNNTWTRSLYGTIPDPEAKVWA